MDLFETAKSVPLPDIADRYGLQTTRKGRRIYCLCPFHPDRHPSLLLNTEGKYAGLYYCSSCQAKGSGIDLVMKLLGLDSRSSAERIVNDFCGGQYGKSDPEEKDHAKKYQNAVSKILGSASFTQTVWNAHYKMSRDAELTEQERLDDLEKSGHDLTEEDSKLYFSSVKDWNEEKQSDLAVSHLIDDLIEQKDYERLARYLMKIKDETMTVYNSLLNMDTETGSHYVRGLQDNGRN